MRADGATRASARGVTAVRIGSGALLGFWRIDGHLHSTPIDRLPDRIDAEWTPNLRIDPMVVSQRQDTPQFFRRDDDRGPILAGELRFFEPLICKHRLEHVRAPRAGGRLPRHATLPPTIRDSSSGSHLLSLTVIFELSEKPHWGGPWEGRWRARGGTASVRFRKC